jgi:hypothetical protein
MELGRFGLIENCFLLLQQIYLNPHFNQVKPNEAYPLKLEEWNVRGELNQTKYGFLIHQ